MSSVSFTPNATRTPPSSTAVDKVPLSFNFCGYCVSDDKNDWLGSFDLKFPANLNTYRVSFPDKGRPVPNQWNFTSMAMDDRGILVSKNTVERLLVSIEKLQAVALTAISFSRDCERGPTEVMSDGRMIRHGIVSRHVKTIKVKMPEEFSTSQAYRLQVSRDEFTQLYAEIVPANQPAPAKPAIDPTSPTLSAEEISNYRKIVAGELNSFYESYLMLAVTGFGLTYDGCEYNGSLPDYSDLIQNEVLKISPQQFADLRLKAQRETSGRLILDSMSSLKLVPKEGHKNIIVGYLRRRVKGDISISTDNVINDMAKRFANNMFNRP